MCVFNLSLLSICIPRSFTVCVAGNFFPPMLRRRHLWSLRPRNMIWNFSGFAIIPFFANQSNRRPRSFPNLIAISCIFDYKATDRGSSREGLGGYNSPSEYASSPVWRWKTIFRRFLAFIVPWNQYFSPLVRRVSPQSENSWRHPRVQS